MTGEVWLIANPQAGGGRGSRHASVAVSSLADANVPCRLVQPRSAEDSTAVAREAVASGARAVVACGGDGTVHAVLQGLVGSDVPLGIMAAGSGDDIAAGLGFSIGDAAVTAAEILALVSGGRTRAVDVGEIQAHDGAQRYFLGVMTTGFDSSVNERANRMPRLGGQRYNVAIVRELASFRPLSYRVTMDGEQHVDLGMLVSVGNGPQYGGGMRICPSALSDDGLLDVTWLAAVSRPTLLRVFPTVFRGTHVEHPAVRTYRARELRIEAPGQICYADGERVGPLPVDVQVRPGVLRVLAG